MSYLLYGTALSCLVEDALLQAEEPLTVGQISQLITADDPSQKDLRLKERVRYSLRQLEADGRVRAGDSVRFRHFHLPTYQITDMADRKGRSFLKAMKAKTEGAQAQMLAGMVKPMIPGIEKMFAQRVADISKPEDQGGILAQGQSVAGYWVTADADGNLIIAECGLTYDAERQAMLMGKPTSVKSLSQILAQDESGS